MRTGSTDLAISVFYDLLSNDLQDPIGYLDHSLGLLEITNYPDAITGFKKVVTLVRRRNRFPKAGKASVTSESSSIPGHLLLYTAYTGLGKAYEASKRVDRAIASYTLALKSYSPNTLRDEWDLFHVGNSERFLSRLLSPRQSESDIEDFLKDYSIASLDSPFAFSCNMCGECCRSSDQILLTPQDIFRLTRSFSDLS
jgi:tetratricopeptide (TPR) repeat protein